MQSLGLSRSAATQNSLSSYPRLPPARRGRIPQASTIVAGLGSKGLFRATVPFRQADDHVAVALARALSHQPILLLTTWPFVRPGINKFNGLASRQNAASDPFLARCDNAILAAQQIRNFGYRKGRGGAVLNSSSGVAVVGKPRGSASDCYTATKGAIAALTRSVAVNYAFDNVPCQCVGSRNHTDPTCVGIS